MAASLYHRTLDHKVYSIGGKFKQDLLDKPGG
jgi:hypothetical protein